MSAVFTTVPNVVGLALAAGESAITAARLVTGTITEQYSNTVKAGLIVSQVPPAGTVIELTGPPAEVPPALLLHFDGANGQTTTIDSSLNALPVTLGGGATLITAGAEFGSACLIVPSGGYVSIPSTPGGPMDFNESDFTIEGWFNPSAVGEQLLFENSGPSRGHGVFAYINSSGNAGVTVQVNDGLWNVSNGLPVPVGVWTHIAVVKLGNEMQVFIGGIGTALEPPIGDIGSPPTTAFYIGYSPDVGSIPFVGMIDEFRITASALYTANFTPGGPFPNPSTPFVPDLAVSLVESLGVAPIGSSIDIAARLDALLPIRWFEGLVPVKEALIAGIAIALEFIYQLFGYVRLQTRIATATDGFLDLIAQDFLGSSLPREPGEIDELYENRIKSGFFPKKNTRADVIRVVTQLTGNVPLIVEPQRPADLGGYGIACGYGVAGRLGSLALPYQMFLTVPRGTSVSDASLYAAIAAVQPIATIVWVKLQ